MKPNKSELLDSYLKNEVNKVTFTYNPSHWEELKNNLDQVQANNNSSSTNLFGKINKYSAFIFIMIASILFVYFLNQSNTPDVVSPDKTPQIENPIHTEGEPANSPELHQNQKHDNTVINPTVNSRTNSNFTPENGQEKALNPDTLNMHRNGKTDLEIENSDKTSKNTFMKSDSITGRDKKNISSMDSIQVKPKKKKFILWN